MFAILPFCTVQLLLTFMPTATVNHPVVSGKFSIPGHPRTTGPVADINELLYYTKPKLFVLMERSSFCRSISFDEYRGMYSREIQVLAVGR